MSRGIIVFGFFSELALQSSSVAFLLIKKQVNVWKTGGQVSTSGFLLEAL